MSNNEQARSLHAILIDAEQDETAMRAALNDMYEHAENDGLGEEYHSELREYNLFQLRITYRQMMYELVEAEAYEKAAILRDLLREKSWQWIVMFSRFFVY